MSAPLGYYDASVPPELLRGYTPPPLVGAARRGTSEGDGTAGTVSVELTVSAGTPGDYSPEVLAADRPRNLDELRERCTVADRAPWPAGSYVLTGTNGKRAHWTGDDWARGESPGYPEVDEQHDDGEGEGGEP